MAPPRALLLPRGPLQVLLLLALAAAAASGAAAQVDIEWKPARATHYSAPGDTWTIHDGSCTHKYIWPDVYPGGGCDGREQQQCINRGQAPCASVAR